MKIGDKVIRKWARGVDFEGKIVEMTESYVKVKPTTGMLRILPAVWCKKDELELLTLK